MNKAALIVALAGIVAGFVPIVIVAIQKHHALKEAEKKLAKDKENERRKNEAKEKMETGDSARDFNNSIDILHNLAKRK